MSAASARFTHSPSTAPIRTREFVIADRRALSLFDGEAAAGDPPPPLRPLWRWQRKDPGWVEGEQRQVRRAGAEAGADRFSEEARERPGEADRLREKQMEGETEDPAPARRTCVGEADR